MKRLLAVILAVLMVCLALPAQSDCMDDAEKLRSFLESRYGISIRIGDECREDPSESFQIVITPEGDTAFQQLVYGNRRYRDLLCLLEDVLSAYSPDFFSGFRWTRDYGGLKFLLVDDILRNGLSYGGFQYGVDTDGRIQIWLSRAGAKERAIHHEIGHAVDYRIRWQEPTALGKWRTEPTTAPFTGAQRQRSRQKAAPGRLFIPQPKLKKQSCRWFISTSTQSRPPWIRSGRSKPNGN